MKHLLYHMLLFCAAGLLGACAKGTETTAGGKPGTGRTLLAYMFADLDTSEEFLTQESYINRLEAGWDDGLDGVCYVYLDASPRMTQFGDAPVLLKIVPDKTEQIVSTVVKTYEYVKPNDYGRYAEVQEDIRTLSPAGSYGLMVFGHGSGWLPDDPDVYDTHTKAVGGRDSFEIGQMAASTADGYEFILFHACLMSNIEALYEFRGKAEYLLASEIELSFAGIDWENTLPYLFTSPKADLSRFLLANTDFYGNYVNAESEEYTPWAFALIRAKALEQLAAETRKLIEAGEVTKEKAEQNTRNFYYIENNGQAVIGPTEDVSTGFADLRHAVHTLTGNTAAWDRAYEEACFLFGNALDPQYAWESEKGLPYFNGISATFPSILSDETLQTIYTTFAWSRDSGMEALR